MTRTRLLWLAIALFVAVALRYLPLEMSILLVGAASFFVVALLWPPVILLALAFAVPFGPTLPLGGFAVGTADLLAGFLLGVWVVRGLAHRHLPRPRVPLVPPLLIYLVALLISLETAWSLKAALPELAKWVEMLALYIAFLALADMRWPLIADLKRALPVFLLLAASAEALLGLAQFFLRIGPPGFIILGRFLRAYGTFAQPNPYAGYLGLVLPLGVSLSLHALTTLIPAARGRITLTLQDWVALLFYPVTTAIIGLGLLASWSRGGWLGMVAGLGLVVALRSRRAAVLSGLLLFLLVAAAVLGAMNLLPAVLSERFQGLEDWTLFLRPVELRSIKITGENFALVERMAHWWAAYAMWLEHPITGVGVGNYPIAYETYRMPGWKDPLGHAHNILLNVMAETGLVGLVAYIVLSAWVFLYGLLALRRTRGHARAIVVGALGGLTHLTVHNLFDNLYVHGMYLYVALLMALLSAGNTPTYDSTTQGEV